MKIVLLGDSITQGIGKLKINYTEKLYEQLKKDYEDEIIDIHNLALTGTTVKYAMGLLERIQEISPDIVVIMYGTVDLQVRPNMETNKFGILSLTPRRYKDIKGMLNPRPFMSKRKGKRFLDCIDNIYRWIWKKIVVMTQGTMQYSDLDTFKAEYLQLLDSLKEYKVIVCSTIYLDNKIYTQKSLQNYEEANKFLEKSNEFYVDLFSKQKDIVRADGWKSIYYNDHFHPNDKGYDIIARELEKMIVRIWSCGNVK